MTTEEQFDLVTAKELEIEDAQAMLETLEMELEEIWQEELDEDSEEEL